MVTRGGSVTAQRLKNVRWTTEEDEILRKCVEEHGEGDWNKIAKLTGLGRSGHSCRERWVHHLCPDIKKGPLSQDEKNLIIKLQAQLGNQWSRIAAELPGRTDNQVKNYCYSLMKRQGAGLTICLQDMEEKAADVFHLQHQQLDHQQQQGRPQSHTPPYSPSATSQLNQKCDAAEKGKGVAGVSSVEEEGNLGVESKKMGTSGEGMKASDQKPREKMNSLVNDLKSLHYPGTNDTSNGSTSTMTAGNQDTNLRNFWPATEEMDSMVDVDPPYPGTNNTFDGYSYQSEDLPLGELWNDDPMVCCVCQVPKVWCVCQKKNEGKI